MSGKPTRVFFVHSRSSTRLGSTQMRCFQLCEIMRRHGSGRFVFDTMLIPSLAMASWREIWALTRPKGAIFIFVKDAIDRLHPAALERLARRAGAILHDPIDRPLSATPRAFVGVHLASSLAQFTALTETLSDARMGRVEVLLHQPDLRLPDTPALPMDRLRPVYFGDPANAFLPETITGHVPVVDVSLAKGMEDKIGLFASANFHYAVRPEDQTRSVDIFKPLTKAVLAARCGAPVMVNRHAHDAEALLGADYPYLVDKTDPTMVLDTLRQAQSDFGGPAWMRAKDVMRALAARVSPTQTARDLEHILERAL